MIPESISVQSVFSVWHVSFAVIGTAATVQKCIISFHLRPQVQIERSVSRTGDKNILTLLCKEKQKNLLFFLSTNKLSETIMSNKTFKILQTYKRVGTVLFGENDASNSTRIGVSCHLLCFMVFANWYIFSAIYFLSFETPSFVEFSETFFSTATVAVALCICILQRNLQTGMSELIDFFETAIEERKSVLLIYIFHLTQLLQQFCLKNYSF